MKLIKTLLAIFIITLSANAFADPVPGKDYKLVEPPQPTHSGNKIEVLEFFFYGCGHCFHLHPELAAWERKIPKDVALVYVPTVFNPSWEPMSYTYYALEALGKIHDLHDELFEAWNIKNIPLIEESKITDFVAQHGVDAKKFSEAYHSFGVGSKVMRGKQITQAYRISGTPTVIVDGKYLITGLQPAETIRVMVELIDKARKERGSGKR